MAKVTVIFMKLHVNVKSINTFNIGRLSKVLDTKLVSKSSNTEIVINKKKNKNIVFLISYHNNCYCYSVTHVFTLKISSLL